MQLAPSDELPQELLSSMVNHSDVPNDNGMTNIINEIVRSITSFLSQENVKNAFTITSPVISIVTNIYTLSTMDHDLIKTPLVTCMLSIHIINLIYSLQKILNVSTLIYEHIKGFVDKALDLTITPLFAKMRKQTTGIVMNSTAHVETILGWVKQIISIVLLGVSVFIPNLNVDEWCKTINTRLTCADKLSTSTEHMTNKIMEDIFHIDLYGSKAIIETRKEMADQGNILCQTSTQSFIRNLEKRRELFSYTELATKTLAEKHNDKLTKALAPFNSVINNNIRTLNEQIKAINECTQSSRRPPTVGVLLTGEKGIGKSKFSEYIMRKIANVLELDSTVYSVSKNGDYFDPYGGEHFGIHDEFLYTRSDDPIISSLTKMISGEYFNFEGASIPSKMQSCELKLLTLTTNIKDPSTTLHKVVNEEAVSAIWDRIVRVEMIDKLVTGRADITGNTHRKPDFSHLTMRMTVSSESKPHSDDYVAITPNEYAMYFTYRIAYNLSEFEDLKGDKPYKTPTIDNYLTENKTTFTNFMKRFSNTCEVDLSKSMEFTNRRIKPNAGRRFFVVRLEGQGGTGKTNSSLEISKRLRNIFNYPILNVSKNFSEINLYPTIYIVDDVFNNENAEDYLNWINDTHHKSIIILVTNIKPIIKRTWTYKPYIDLTGIGQSSGICRRLGLTGAIKHGYENFLLSDTDSVYIKAEQSYMINNELVDLNKIHEIVFEKYINFIRFTREITIVKSHGELDNPDITIDISNFNNYNRYMASPKLLLKSLIKNDEFYVSLKNIGLYKELSNISSPEEFSMTPVTNFNQLIDSIKLMITKLMIYKPTITLKAVCQDPKVMILYYDNCIYYTESIFNSIITCNEKLEEVYIPLNGNTHIIKLCDLAWLSAHAIKNNSVMGLTSDDISMILEYINTNRYLKNKYSILYHSYLINKEVTAHNSLLQKKEPKIWKYIKLVLKIGGITVIGLSIYKLLPTSKNTNNYKKNHVSDTDNVKREEISSKYIKGVSERGDYQLVKREIIDEYGMDAWRDAEYYMRNTLISLTKKDTQNDDTLTANELIMQNKWAELQKYWVNNPSDLPSIKSNMVTVQDIDFQKSNEIENFANILEDNIVILVNEKTKSRNFAIGLRNDILVSVAHAYTGDNSSLYIVNNGTKYKIKCLELNRSTDLAYYRLETQSFSFRNIMKHIGTQDLSDKYTEAYYIRPIKDNRLIAATTVSYVPKRYKPLGQEEFFRPDSKLYVAVFSTVSRPVFIKNGDCGLPLVVKTVNGFKLIGIHNAYSENDPVAFFCSLNLTDVNKVLGNDIKSNSDESSIYHFHNPATKYTTHKWYKDIIDGTFRQSKLPPSGLVVLGYSEQAHLHSNPKCTHKEIFTKEQRKEIGELLPTKPAALKFCDKIMSPDKLVRDRNGMPHTLWTQAVKYTHREPLYQQWDQIVYDRTFEIIKQRIRRDYGKAGFMSINTNINGNNTNHNKGWDMSTSAGPLLKALYKVNTKSEIFTNTAPENIKPFYKFNDSEGAKLTRKLYEEYTESLESGKPVAMFCKDNRKVELLAAAKVHEGKVRLFNEMDFALNMTFKKYFGHMVSRIKETHHLTPYKIGMDIYSEATLYHNMIHRIDGNLISTDISGCDKSMPKELIYQFCEAFCQDYDPKLIHALAQTLCYSYHIMDGVVYLVKNGNESGDFITTELNCFAMETITVYPVVEALMTLGINPCLTNVEENLSAMYCGDDRSAKFHSDLNITEKDLVRCGSYYNFKVTPAKVACDDISFCSRTFIPDENGMVFPKLKETSILSCLFWVKQKDVMSISANISAAIFEASLHNKEFFSRVIKIVEKIIECYPQVKPWVNIYEYEDYRNVFRRYIYGDSNTPVLLTTGMTDLSLIKYADDLIDITPNNLIKIMDYISQLNHESQKTGKMPTFTYERNGPQETPTWQCTAKYGDKTITSTSSTKKSAQQEAARILVENKINPNTDIQNDILDLEQGLIINMKDEVDMLQNLEYLNYFSKKPNLTSYDDGMLSIDLDKQHKIDELNLELSNMGYTVKKIQILSGYNSMPYKYRIYIGKLFISANSDTSIEPAIMNQAAMGQQRANLPSQTNPQPTAINPAMTHSGDDIMGAITTSLPETLNPIGAPDMLAVGAITFDIKDLIYQQFLDCDTQIVVSDDATEGSIIAQIPYGLQSQYINSYIKYYAKAHERFNGSIQFRMTVIGNPLFSGAIGIAWYPRKVKTTNMPISELMKYSYQAEGVTNPWNKVHVLHDARREHFYRLVEDDAEDYDNRPHLVIFLMMSLQNPLKEGVQTRIRIASKLSNSGEANPFTFSNPDILVASPSLTTNIPGLTTPQGSNVPSVFPHTLNLESNVFTDGTMSAPQVFDFGTSNRPLITNAPLNGAMVARNGSTLIESDNFQFGYTQMYRLYSYSPQTGYPTLFWYSNVPRAQYLQFGQILSDIKTQAFRLTSNTAPHDYLGSDPDAFRETLVEACNTVNLNYLRSGFGVVGLYSSRPDTDSPHRFGLFKIVTTHGVIFSCITVIPLNGNAPNQNELDTRAPTVVGNWGSMTYTGIDVPININTVATALPGDYQVLRISEQAVSALISSTISNPTATDDASISKYYKRLAFDLDVQQCYQFELQDPISFRVIATIRYLQEYGIFVVRGLDKYAYLGQPFSKLIITTPIIVNRTSSFPSTDTSTWLSRVSSTFKQSKLLDFYSDPNNEIEVQPNAMGIAGGMMSGLGGAMGKKADRKHELSLQGNQLEHEKEMQGSDQTYGLKYQKRGFMGSALLSGQNYKQSSALSKQAHKQTKDYAAQQQVFKEKDQNRELLLTGARAEVSGATSAVSHA